ncbi:MAG: alpha/beta hydrolase [Clostridiales bacterium]|jgi:acetyl esterase/lipase|nr:alpha/beta hydrolase [Clostridiales bacterium]
MMKCEQFYRNELVRLDSYVLGPQPREENRRPRPAVIICPGSGYVRCAEVESEAIALQFAAAGFHSFVLWYSVSELRTAPLWPEPLLDAAWAVDFVRGRANEWSVRKDGVFLVGFSAGGHLAASLCVHWARPEVRSAYPLSRPDGSILGYPVITSGEYAHQGSIDSLTAGDPDLLKLARLEDFVGPDTPPAFLWHTFTDEAVPVQNSLLYAAALAKHGVPFELHVFPEGRHGLSLANPETGCEASPNNRHMARWLDLCAEWIKLRAGEPF